jgi:hypothetical protein
MRSLEEKYRKQRWAPINGCVATRQCGTWPARLGDVEQWQGIDDTGCPRPCLAHGALTAAVGVEELEGLANLLLLLLRQLELLLVRALGGLAVAGRLRMGRVGFLGENEREGLEDRAVSCKASRGRCGRTARMHVARDRTHHFDRFTACREGADLCCQLKRATPPDLLVRVVVKTAHATLGKLNFAPASTILLWRGRNCSTSMRLQV